MWPLHSHLHITDKFHIIMLKNSQLDKKQTKQTNKKKKTVYFEQTVINSIRLTAKTSCSYNSKRLTLCTMITNLKD